MKSQAYAYVVLTVLLFVACGVTGAVGAGITNRHPDTVASNALGTGIIFLGIVLGAGALGTAALAIGTYDYAIKEERSNRGLRS